MQDLIQNRMIAAIAVLGVCLLGMNAFANLPHLEDFDASAGCIDTSSSSTFPGISEFGDGLDADLELVTGTSGGGDTLCSETFPAAIGVLVQVTYPSDGRPVDETGGGSWMSGIRLRHQADGSEYRVELEARGSNYDNSVGLVTILRAGTSGGAAILSPGYGVALPSIGVLGYPYVLEAVVETLPSGNVEISAFVNGQLIVLATDDGISTGAGGRSEDTLGTITADGQVGLRYAGQIGGLNIAFDDLCITDPFGDCAPPTPLTNEEIQALIDAAIANIELTPGPAGSQGPQGKQGPTGTAGSDGAQGPQGEQGPDGAGSDGAQGPQGKQGAAGADAPCTPCADVAGAAVELACIILDVNPATNIQELQDTAQVLVNTLMISANICEVSCDVGGEIQAAIDTKLNSP